MRFETTMGSIGRVSVFALVGVVTAAACGGTSAPSTSPPVGSSAAASGAPTVANKEPYSVAWQGILSGAAAPFGAGELDGFKAYVDYLNANGGIDGHPVKVIVQDDKLDAGVAASLTRSAAEQKASAIFGISISNILPGMIPLSEELGISIISGGTAPSTLMPPKKWIFSNDIPGVAEAPAEFAFAKIVTGKDKPKIAISPQDNAGQLEWAAAFEKLANSQGVTLVANVPLPLTATDVSAQAQRLASANPDVIVAHITGAPMVLMVQKLRQLGYKGPFLDYHGAAGDQPMVELNDPDAYVSRSVRGLGDAGGPNFDRFLKAVRAAGKEDVFRGSAQPSATGGYIQATIMEAGFRKCGFPCDAAAFNKAISDITIDSGVAWGPLIINAQRHQSVDSVVWFHVVSGKMTAAANGKVFTGVLTPNGPVER